MLRPYRGHVAAMFAQTRALAFPSGEGVTERCGVTDEEGVGLMCSHKRSLEVLTINAICCKHLLLRLSSSTASGPPSPLGKATVAVLFAHDLSMCHPEGGNRAAREDLANGNKAVCVVCSH